MIVAIHQPNLFPRMKTLQKLALADVWIVLDDVQYCQREYQNRAFIVPLKGSNYWCTLPVTLPNGKNTKIKDVVFVHDNPMIVLRNTFKHCYKGDSENKAIFENFLTQMERKPQSNFTEFVVGSAIVMLDYAGLCPKIIYSSDLYDTTIGKTDKLVSLCQKLNADTYIADSGGAHYIDESVFASAHINVLWQVWDIPCQSSLKPIANYIRDGSGLNVLARSSTDFISIVSQSKVSKRSFAEGK